MEEWMYLEEFPNYFVNKKGQVKSFVKNKKGRILNGYNTLGYRGVRIFKKDVKVGIMIHRLVAFAFIPNPENKPFINHKNGIKHDNRVENLEWCTQSENMIHAYKSGLCSDRKGINNGRAIVNEKTVIEIRKIKDKSISQISRDYNLSWDCVNKIIKNKTWTHVV